jgi:hypothetical protein
MNMPRNDFDFFLIIAEIFDSSGASPLSTTPAKHDFTGVYDNDNYTEPV